ncbi:hypothetical protein JGK44_000201 [Shewanella algae]|nr:hypothetical protein [Shewanella algae]
MFDLMFIKQSGLGWYNEKQLHVKGYGFNLNNDFLEGKALVDYFSQSSDVNALKVLARELNGAFSVVIEDSEFVILISDKLRSIPLFYSNDEEKIFISDYLGEAAAKNREVESSSINSFIYAGCTIGSKTLLKNVSQILSSEIVMISKKSKLIKKDRYFDHKHSYKNNYDKFDSYDRLDSITNNFIERLKVSAKEKTLIIPLSGGYDSRYILTALVRANFSNIICYTYGDPKSFEISVAKKVAKNLDVVLHVVEYSEDKWKSLLEDKDFSSYLKFAFNYSSVPHVQDYLALRELKENKLLPSDGIIIPGFCGDLLGGSYMPKEIVEGNESELLKNKISDYIFAKQFANSKEELDSVAKSEILSQISFEIAKDESFNLDDLISTNEVFLTEHKVSKFVVNSLRVYEFFGFEWRMPLWDDELITFWYNVPNVDRVDSKLYNDYLFLKLFEPLNVAFLKSTPVSRKKVSLFLRRILPLSFLEKLRSVYQFSFKKVGIGDVNNFNLVSKILLDECELDMKCNNVNGALAYYIIEKLLKDKF